MRDAEWLNDVSDLIPQLDAIEKEVERASEQVVGRRADLGLVERTRLHEWRHDHIRSASLEQLGLLRGAAVGGDGDGPSSQVFHPAIVEVGRARSSTLPLRVREPDLTSV